MSSMLPSTWTHRAWRDTPVARIFWAFASWALFSASLSLLIASAFGVMALGGTCANGGPYEIRVECPDNVALFTPLSVFGGLIAVGVSSLLARGFALPLVGWAWTILFVGLSVPFFVAAAAGDITGIIVGVVFAVMGIGLPVGLIAQGKLGYLLVGSCDVRGRPFTRSVPAEPSWSNADAPRTGGPTAADVVLALSIPAVGVGVGLLLARLLWSTVL